MVGGAEKPLAAGTVPPFTSSRTRRKKRSLSVSPDEEFSVILRSSLAGINLEKKKMSWKAEFQTCNDEKWYTNSVRLATKEEAEWSAKDIANRWLLVTSWRVTESDDPVNWAVINGEMRLVENASEETT